MFNYHYFHQTMTSILTINLIKIHQFQLVQHRILPLDIHRFLFKFMS